MCWTMWVTLMLRGQSDKAMRVAEDVTDGYKSVYAPLQPIFQLLLFIFLMQWSWLAVLV